MQKNIKENAKKRSVTDKYKDDIICYVGVEVVLCR